VVTLTLVAPKLNIESAVVEAILSSKVYVIAVKQNGLDFVQTFGANEVTVAYLISWL
jgi:hypothetical protein